MSNISQLFTSVGGQFLTPEVTMIENLKHIKAFVFDWDGVFTDASKDHLMQSKFNEADSMGVNLLRFSYFLKHNHLPITAIISGEKNQAAFTFIERERLHFSYSKCANKLIAANHLCKTQNIQLHEICYVFDDVLDLSLAEQCGIRIFIPRPNNPLFNEYVYKHRIADYVTAGSCGNFAVREACELLMGLTGNFDAVIDERKGFTEIYNSYLNLRKATTPEFYTIQNDEVVSSNS